MIYQEPTPQSTKVAVLIRFNDFLSAKDAPKKDEDADDKSFSDVNFYVNGVHSKVPGGDKK
jgi:hypothetical protein